MSVAFPIEAHQLVVIKLSLEVDQVFAQPSTVLGNIGKSRRRVLYVIKEGGRLKVFLAFGNDHV